MNGAVPAWACHVAVGVGVHDSEVCPVSVLGSTFAVVSWLPAPSVAAGSGAGLGEQAAAPKAKTAMAARSQARTGFHLPVWAAPPATTSSDTLQRRKERIQDRWLWTTEPINPWQTRRPPRRPPV